MSETVERIKEKLSIVEVVQSYVKLTKAGKYWKGLSPFNKEKTPSFYVSPDRGLYHCFSSGKGGDMFTFVEEMEGVDFRGALKILAERAGVPLIAEKPGARDQRERLYAVLDAACAYYSDELKKRNEVQQYLADRGVTKESVAQWNLGYAPRAWQELRNHLTAEGYTEDELARAGLIKRAEKDEVPGQPAQETSDKALRARFYDRFRGRIMFPIRDVSGRTIAFSGRIFEDDAAHPQAKYINSPESEIFVKSRALYGVERARDSIRSLNAAILVEGQMDLIMSHQIGYRNAIATSGTAFTVEHAEALKHYSDNLLIAYDGDRAGIAAAGRAATLAIPLGMNVKISKFAPGDDPADLILKDASQFKESIKNALHIIDFYIAHIEDAKYDARRYRLEVSRVVIPYIAMIPNKIDQAHFVKRVSEKLGINEEAVLAEVKKMATSTPEAARYDTTKAEPFLSRGDALERLVLGLMRAFDESGDSEAALRARTTLLNAVGEERFKVLLESPPDIMRAAEFEADFFLERSADADVLAQSLEEVYAELQKESYHEQYRETLRALRNAEGAHDVDATDSLMQQLSRLAPRLK